MFNYGVFSNVAKFLTVQELLTTYIVNNSLKEQTKDVQLIWRYHCEQLTVLLQVENIKRPIYQNYQTLIKLNNVTLKK